MTWRALWLRLMYPFNQRRVERELREEMAVHLALRTEQLTASGMPAAQAAEAARRRFGNASRLAHAAREPWGWHWLDGTGQDLHYVIRQLRRSPGFTLVAMLTIALGVGINATAFTFYDAIVLKPLPVREPGTMVRVVQDAPIPNSDELPYSGYDALHRNARTIQSVVTETAPQPLSAVLPGHSTDDARMVTARFVSPNFFDALGIHPAVGRWSGGDEAAVVLDYSFWSNQLGSDPNVVGRRIDVRGIQLTIVGIAPEGFAGTGVPALAPNLWIPLSLQPTLIPGGDWRYDARPHWQVLGRATLEASPARMAAELGSLHLSVLDTTGKPVPLVAKHATFFQTDAGEFEVFKQVSAALMVALALILSIAVINLVNVLAARNAAREREVSVRLALGASRARIARQLAGESLVVAIAGGLLGLVISGWLAASLRAWVIGTVSSVSDGLAGVYFDVRLDWRVIAYTGLLSLAIGLVVGIWPALRAARGDANSLLRQGTTSTAGRGAWGKRNLLLSSQVAGSLILLTAAGMLLGGLRFADHIDPGFDARHMVVVNIPDGTHPNAERVATRAEIARRIAALPGVRSVAWSRRVPFAGTHLRTTGTPDRRVTISIGDVGDTYFDAMNMPILRGRGFTRRETETDAPVMIVSAAAARLRWPGQDPIGRSVPANDYFRGPDTTRSYTVVGIVPDVRTNFLSRIDAPSVYFPHGFGDDYGSYLVRTRGNPSATINAIRVVTSSVSPTVARDVHALTMEDGPMAVQRLFAEAPAMIALVVALAGLLLASVGVYGLIAQIVTRRTREIGVHMALGARPGQVIGLVIRKTLRPVTWGVVVGSAGAIGLSIFLRSMIATPDVPDLTFGAGAFNPLVFLGVLGAICVVVVAACFAPARRAATVDPVVALRVD